MENEIKSSEFSPDNSALLTLKKALGDKDREITYLKRELLGLEYYKDQNASLEKQYKLLRDKLSLVEEFTSKKNSRETASKSCQTAQDIVFCLETENESLIKKLEKNEFVLQDTVTELKEAQGKLKNSDSLVLNLNTQIENERKLKEKAESEKKDKEKVLIRILETTKGVEPIKYLRELNIQIENLRSELDNYKYKHSSLCDNLRPLLDECPGIENDLVFEKLGQILLKKKIDLKEKELEIEELKNALLKHEDTIVFLNNKQSEVSTHIERQEIIYHKIANEKDKFHQMYNQNTQELNEIREIMLHVVNESTVLQMARDLVHLFNDSESTNKKYQIMLKEQQKELNFLKENNRKLKSRLIEFRNKLNEMIEENTALSDTIIDLENMLKTTKEELSSEIELRYEELKIKEFEFQQVFSLFLSLFKKYTECASLKSFSSQLVFSYSQEIHKIKSLVNSNPKKNRLRTYGKFIIAVLRISKCSKKNYTIEIHGFSFQSPLIMNQILSNIIHQIPSPNAPHFSYKRNKTTLASLVEFEIEKLKERNTFLYSQKSPLSKYNEIDRKTKEQERINQECKKEALEMQSSIELLNFQKSELLKDNELKAKHITSLELIIQRLENKISLNDSRKSQSSSNEVEYLSQLLEQLMKDYSELEQKNKVNIHTIKHLRKKIDEKDPRSGRDRRSMHQIISNRLSSPESNDTMTLFHL